jgi:membrane associated rhomboid family serine protease
MFFPIGDQNVVGGYKPLFSYTFIVVNVIIFLYQITLSPELCAQFVNDYGTTPGNIVQGQGWSTLITSMFIHGGWMHLLGNMMFLWVFADNIEAVIGNVNFFGFYILGGLAASAAHILFNPLSSIPAVGASGAISAVLGAYLIVFPHSRIKTLVLFFFVSLPAILFLGFWIVQQLINGIGSLSATSAHTGGVAWWAHIGGFVFGVVAGLFIRRSYQGHQIEEY